MMLFPLTSSVTVGKLISCIFLCPSVMKRKTHKDVLSIHNDHLPSEMREKKKTEILFYRYFLGVGLLSYHFVCFLCK